MTRYITATIVAILFNLTVLAAYNAVCFFSYERTSGMNRICFYDCLSGTAAITISAVRLCPLTIQD